MAVVNPVADGGSGPIDVRILSLSQGIPRMTVQRNGDDVQIQVFMVVHGEN